MQVQSAKNTVREYCQAIDLASQDQLISTLERFTTPDYQWRGMHPFHEQSGAVATIECFWLPLRKAFTSLQRRPDVFLAGENTVPLTESTRKTDKAASGTADNDNR
jgi:hypothetical protein